MKRNLITAGVDEVGRGCLAGPVVSAAVILNENIDLKLLKDSKRINFKNRIKIAEHIKLNSHYAIGVASVETTGPAKHPLPTSSTPAIIILCFN